MSAEFDGRLIDGSMPMQPAQLLSALDEAGIQHRTIEHAPMWTVEDAKSIREPSAYGHTKNLFVRNKKGGMWLLTLHEDRMLDMKSIAALVGARRLSFASEQRLMRYLGVTPGAVSMFSILNDVTGVVQCCIDESLMHSPELHIHPLVNTLTTTIPRLALLKFLEERGHVFDVLHFDQPLP